MKTYQVLEVRKSNDELERRIQELALLNRIITATNTAQDPVELLTIACRELAQIFGAPQAGAALLNEEQTSLTVVAEFLAEGRPSAMGHVIPVAGNLATQHVLKHKEPLPIEDVLNDPRMAPIRHLAEERGTKSMLILPLLARDEVIGTIGLDLIETHEFTGDEVHLAFNAATSIAQSLANARMFDQVQVTLAELQRVEEARQFTHDELDRYLPEAIREKIEKTYYAKVNQQAELDHVVRNKEFIKNPLDHVALFSDHGVVHVRDVAHNIVSVLDKINGVLIPHRNRLWLDFMKGYGVMLAYNHDIGMMDFSNFGRAMHPEFAAQAVFNPEYDPIVDTIWEENWGNVSWRLIKLAENGALQGDLKNILRELLAMSIGHSKSKVSNQLLNDPKALRTLLLESISTELGLLYRKQQVRKEQKKLENLQLKGETFAIAAQSAALERAQEEEQKYLDREEDHGTPLLHNYYTNFEEEAFTWMIHDHPALQALTRDVVDTLRALRVADALRQRGTTLKTSGGYQILIDQNTADAVIALQKSSGEMIMLEVQKTHSIGEANIASSEITLGGNLRLSFHRGSFRTEEAVRHAAYCCAVIIDDIQRDILDSFWRPDQPSTLRKNCDDIEILIEETDDNIHFSEIVLEELTRINPTLFQRSRIVPSLKHISDVERQRYLTATELNWSLERRRGVVDLVAQTGHKTQRIDPEIAFTDVRLIELHQGEVLLEAGAPPGFVYVPMGNGLQTLPLGGYQRQDVQPWIPLGNTSVIRGDVQEARITAEKYIQLLIIPKEIYLKYWHDTYNLTEFSPTLDRLFAKDELDRMNMALSILKQVVLIDGILDDSEVVYIQQYMELMGENVEPEEIRAELADREKTDFPELRQAIIEYLQTAPPYLQVARLRDLIKLVAEASELISSEKQMLHRELIGLLDNYLDRDADAVQYQVVVVPQSTEQDTAIRALLPAASRIEIGFGYAYLCDVFQSREYAEMIRNRYRSLRLFALIIQGGENDMAEIEDLEEDEFTDEERELYAAFIHRFTPSEFIKLVRIGTWHQAEAGESLIKEGQSVDQILFIIKGHSVVSADGETLHAIKSGSFVGEMEFMAGGPAVATVTTESLVRYIAWQKESLEHLLTFQPEMQSAMQTLFSADVVKKLQTRIDRLVEKPGMASKDYLDSISKKE